MLKKRSMICLVFALVSLMIVSSLSIFAAPKVITIKYTEVNPSAPKGNPVAEAPLYFAKKIKAYSKGQIICQAYLGGQLGGEMDNLGAIKVGTIQMMQPSVAPLENYYPKFSIYEIPFLFDGRKHLLKFTRTSLGKKMEVEFEQKTGLKVLDYVWESDRGLFNKVKPIYSPADMKGMKVRVMEGEIWKDTFEAFGALPVPLPYTELYSALGSNLVVCADPPISSYKGMKFYEVAPYYTLLGHAQCFKPVIINAKFFNSLSKANQKLVRKAIAEATEEERSLSFSLDDYFIKYCANAGAKINNPNRKEFKKAVAPVYTKWSKKLGEEFFDEVLQVVKETAPEE
jgi:tripartite ATP-independent transporter DctP family solute receptor